VCAVRLRKLTIAMTVGTAAAGLSIGLASSASATPGFDIRGSWSEVASTQGANYPQTVTYTTEDMKTGAVTGSDVGGGATFTVTGTLNGSTLTTDTVEPGYTSHAVGTIKRSGSTLTMSGTFTDSVGHPGGTFTATFNGSAASVPSDASSDDLGPVPFPCPDPTPPGTRCTYNSRDGALTFTPNVVKIGETIVAKMVSPSGAGTSWTWPYEPGLNPQNCAPSAVTCTYLATAASGPPGQRYVIATVLGNSVQGPWTSAQAYAVEDTGFVSSGGKVLDVRGLWDGFYVAPGGAKYHNPVTFVTEDFTTGELNGTDNGTDGPATITGHIAGRTITGTISQPPSYTADVSWVISDDGTKLIANGITDPNAINAFVLTRQGPPVAAAGGGGGRSGVTSGAGVTSGPAPITALPTPAQAFSSPARIAASVGISIAALLLITFPANLFNKTFEENYDVITAWWEPRLRRFRRKPTATTVDGGEAAAADDEAVQASQALQRERWTFGAVVVAGAILGGLLNPKFGANSASADSFIATLLTVLTGTVLGAAVATVYRRRKGYEVTHHLQALPAGLAIAALCVVLSRVSNFQPGYLYGVVCGVAFAGALAKNENGHLVALGHLATIGLAVVAWFLWVPVNHAAVHHPGVFPLVILDDLLASLFVGGLVGSVINLIPVRFMPGHALASWHRGAWMAVFGVAAFGMTEIVLFPSLHNHAGHAPLVTIIVLFVLFGGGSLAFREYFSRRTKRLEFAVAAPVDGAPIPEQPSIPEPRPEPADQSQRATAADPPGVH
jgi:hypothetical protein